MFVTTEILFINPELNEINIFTKNTQLQCNQKFGYDYSSKVIVKCIVKFVDKKENKRKNFMIEYENIIGKENKISHSSKGVIKFIRALELTIRLQGRIHKNVNASLNCDGIPILWIKQNLKMAHDEGYKYNQYCRIRYVHHFTSCNGCFLLHNFISI